MPQKTFSSSQFKILDFFLSAVVGKTISNILMLITDSYLGKKDSLENPLTQCSYPEELLLDNMDTSSPVVIRDLASAGPFIFKLRNLGMIVVLNLH